MRTKSWYAWMVVAMAVAPAGLAAQDGAEAARLEASASTLGMSRPDLSKAADLLRQAASKRPSGDPAAVRDLVESARFSFYAGKPQRALEDFAFAAESALRIGDLVAAAESFTDAAWVAKQVHDGRRTIRYTLRARELTSSPGLSEADRTRLLARLPG